MALPQLGPILPQSSAHRLHRTTPHSSEPLSVAQLCANLDTWRIMSPQTHLPELQEHNRLPCKQYDLCHRRSQVCGGRGGAGEGRGRGLE